MELEFKIKVGSTEIKITESAASQREFFEKVSFFSGMPTKGPNGADDLKIVYRKTKGGDEFYSLVSEKDDQEFKFGIHKNAEKTLFPKGWTPLYKGEVNEGDQNQETSAQAPTENRGPFNRAQTPKSTQASAQQKEPEYTPAETPAASSAPQAQPKVPGNPQVNNILNKYLNKAKA